MSDRSLVISACLLGRPCRYDGAARPSTAAQETAGAWRAAGGAVVAVCREELGGLGTPRPAAELRGGDGEAALRGGARVVRLVDGADVTAAFVAGARRALSRASGAAGAVLKARSPSCGVGRTHVDGEVRPGDGVFAALLRARGVPLWTEETLGDVDGGRGRPTP